jgi:hypothetical protein
MLDYPEIANVPSINSKNGAKSAIAGHPIPVDEAPTLESACKTAGMRKINRTQGTAVLAGLGLVTWVAED